MLIGAGEIIDHTWDLYRKNFKLYLRLILWMIVPSTLFSAVQPYLFNLSSGLDWWMTPILSLLFAIPFYLLSLYIEITVVQATAALLGKEPPDPAKLLRGAVTLLLPTLVTSIVFSLIVTAGALLFIIPALIFSVWFAFSVPLTIVDRLRWREALRASRALTSGRFWQVLWRLAAPGMFWGVATLVVSSAFSFLINGLTGTWSIAIENPPLHIQSVSDALSGIIGGIAAPLWLISSVILLVDLKRETKITTEYPNQP